MSNKESHISAWKQLRQGNKDALLLLYNEHYVGLLNYGLKVTQNREIIKDAITHILLRLWDRRASLPHVGNVRSYLLTTLHRELLAEIKMENKRHSKYTEAAHNLPIEEKSYEDLIIQLQHNNELKQKLLLAFNDLTSREKELLQLKFFEDLDYEDIAERCQISKRTVYNIIHRALKTLRFMLISAPKVSSIPEKILLGYILFILMQF